ncbi:MAG: Flagellar hook-associated protein FlgK, partial [uncultured Craurococcus sp.]
EPRPRPRHRPQRPRRRPAQPGAGLAERRQRRDAGLCAKDGAAAIAGRRRHAGGAAQRRHAACGRPRPARPARPEPRRHRRRHGARGAAGRHRQGAWHDRRRRDARRCGGGAVDRLHHAAWLTGRCRAAARGTGGRRHRRREAERRRGGDRRGAAAGAGRHRHRGRGGQRGAAADRHPHHPDQVRHRRGPGRARGPARPGDRCPRPEPGAPGGPPAGRRPAAHCPRRAGAAARPGPGCAGDGARQRRAGVLSWRRRDPAGNHAERHRRHRPDRRRPARRICGHARPHPAALPGGDGSPRRHPRQPVRPAGADALHRSRRKLGAGYRGGLCRERAGRLRRAHPARQRGLGRSGPAARRHPCGDAERRRAGWIHPQPAGRAGRLHHDARPRAELEPRRRGFEGQSLATDRQCRARAGRDARLALHAGGADRRLCQQRHRGAARRQRGGGGGEEPGGQSAGRPRRPLHRRLRRRRRCGDGGDGDAAERLRRQCQGHQHLAGHVGFAARRGAL